MSKMEQWVREVDALLDAAQGADEPSEAMRLYTQALDRLPPSAERSLHATEILTAIGELHYVEGRLAEAFDYFSRAVACEGGLGLPHIHLRLGQLRAARGEMDRARDELMRAYMGSGELIFKDQDPKYYGLIKDIVERR